MASFGPPRYEELVGNGGMRAGGLVKNELPLRPRYLSKTYGDGKPHTPKYVRTPEPTPLSLTLLQPGSL